MIGPLRRGLARLLSPQASQTQRYDAAREDRHQTQRFEGDGHPPYDGAPRHSHEHLTIDGEYQRLDDEK